MDSVYIQGLSVETIIGIHDWERKTKQTIVIDIEMSTQADRAAVSDWIGYAVDYSAVSERVVEFAEASQYKLIETLAAGKDCHARVRGALGPAAHQQARGRGKGQGCRRGYRAW